MRRFPPIFFCTAGVAILLIDPVAVAQTLRLQPDGSLEVCFTKPLIAVAAVEQSADLVFWVPAVIDDEVISQDSKYDTHCATIFIPSGTTKLFLRLRVSNAWTVSLSWAASPSRDVAGYCLYYGTTSGNYVYNLAVGNRLQAIVSMPVETKVCYFVVTAYTAIGLQSLPSHEVIVKAKAKTKKKRKKGTS